MKYRKINMREYERMRMRGERGQKVGREWKRDREKEKNVKKKKKDKACKISTYEMETSIN